MESVSTVDEPESLRENARPTTDALLIDWKTGTVCDQIHDSLRNDCSLCPHFLWIENQFFLRLRDTATCQPDRIDSVKKDRTR